MPVRLVLVDDHEMVIEGLKAMLAAFKDRVQVVGQAVGADRLADDRDPLGEGRQHRFEALNDHLVVIDKHETYRRSGSSRHITTLRPVILRGRGTARGRLHILASPIPQLGEDHAE